MTTEPALQQELAFFEHHRKEYVKLYKGQFVLIKGKELIAVFSNEADAYRAGLERLGNSPFLIKQILDEDTKVSYPALTVGAINIHP